MDGRQNPNGSRPALLAVIAAIIAAGVVGTGFLLAGGGSSTQTIQPSTSGQYSPRGLELFLRLHTNITGTLLISANETNLLDRVNNVTAQEDWAYPGASNSSEPCGNYDQIPLEYAILPGVYGKDNYTGAPALTLYNPGIGYSCPTIIAPWKYILFSPLGDNVSYLSTYGGEDNLVSWNFSESGYWTGHGSTASYQKFPVGSNTFLMEDEWGSVALLTFRVNENGDFIVLISSSQVSG